MVKQRDTVREDWVRIVGQTRLIWFSVAANPFSLGIGLSLRICAYTTSSFLSSFTFLKLINSNLTKYQEKGEK